MTGAASLYLFVGPIVFIALWALALYLGFGEQGPAWLIPVLFVLLLVMAVAWIVTFMLMLGGWVTFDWPLAWDS